MPFKKGRKKEGGRKKGGLNKQTRDIKEIHGRILEVISGTITIEKLVKEVKKDTLMNYLAKTMPKDLNISGKITSENVDIKLTKEEKARFKKELGYVFGDSIKKS